MQLPAPANGLAVPPPAVSTAKEEDLSVGATILEDPRPGADGGGYGGAGGGGDAGGAALTRAAFLPDSRCLFILI